MLKSLKPDGWGAETELIQNESLFKAGRELKQLKSPVTDWGIIKQNPAPNQLLKYFASVKKYGYFYQFQCVSAAQRLQKSN